MHILIGLAIAVALLYFWLIGHWFARVLVFLALGIGIFAIAASAINFGLYGGKAPLGLLFVELPLAALAWPLASLPAYYWRQRRRHFMAASAVVARSGGWPP